MLTRITPIESRYIRREVIKTSINAKYDQARPFQEKTPGGTKVSTIVPCTMKIESELHPAMSVALFEKKGKEETYYVMGYSILGDKDNFSYKAAKEVAAERAMKRSAVIKDKAQRILPSEEDIKRVPKEFRKEFVSICAEFYNKYSNLNN